MAPCTAGQSRFLSHLWCSLETIRIMLVKIARTGKVGEECLLGKVGRRIGVFRMVCWLGWFGAVVYL